MLQLRDDDKDLRFNFESDREFSIVVWASSNDFINSSFANSSF